MPKKKWKDRTFEKKKERKRLVEKTGGGPPPEAFYKSWELDVMFRFHLVYLILILLLSFYFTYLKVCNLLLTCCIL